MSDAGRSRLALSIPISSPREILAAIQVVIFVLQWGRVELDVVRDSAFATAGQPRPRVLFVSVDVTRQGIGPTALAEWERGLRARIQRAYARHGIRRVNYDLQII